MFHYFSKELRLIRKYKRYQKSKLGKAEHFVRQKCKEATAQSIVIVKNVNFLDKTRYSKINFTLYSRKTIKRGKRPVWMDNNTWILYQQAQQYQLDLIIIKKKNMQPKQFVLTGYISQKRGKRPPILIGKVPSDIRLLGEKFANGERIDLSKITPYLNPAYLEYEPEKYVVKCEEIKNATKKKETRRSRKRN